MTARLCPDTWLECCGHGRPRLATASVPLSHAVRPNTLSRHPSGGHTRYPAGQSGGMCRQTRRHVSTGGAVAHRSGAGTCRRAAPAGLGSSAPPWHFRQFGTAAPAVGAWPCRRHFRQLASAVAIRHFGGAAWHFRHVRQCGPAVRWSGPDPLTRAAVIRRRHRSRREGRSPLHRSSERRVARQAARMPRLSAGDPTRAGPTRPEHTY